MIKKCEKYMPCRKYKEKRSSSSNRDAGPWIVEINLLQGCLPLVLLVYFSLYSLSYKWSALSFNCDRYLIPLYFSFLFMIGMYLRTWAKINFIVLSESLIISFQLFSPFILKKKINLFIMTDDCYLIKNIIMKGQVWY